MCTQCYRPSVQNAPDHKGRVTMSTLFPFMRILSLQTQQPALPNIHKSQVNLVNASQSSKEQTCGWLSEISSNHYSITQRTPKSTPPLSVWVFVKSLCLLSSSRILKDSDIFTTHKKRWWTSSPHHRTALLCFYWICSKIGWKSILCHTCSWSKNTYSQQKRFT